MRRRAAGIRIELIEDKRTGKHTELRLDKAGMEFYATIGEDTKRSKDAHEVRAWARKLLAQDDSVEWVPVLYVHANDEYEGRYGYSRGEAKHSAGVSVKVDRYYIGRTPGGKWFQTSWESCDEDSTEYLDPAERLARASRFETAEHAEDPSYHSNRGLRNTTPPPFKLPHRVGDHHYLPYDEQAYSGAVTIVRNIQDTGKALSALLASRKGVATLQAIAAGAAMPALPSGRKARNED